MRMQTCQHHLCLLENADKACGVERTNLHVVFHQETHGMVQNEEYYGLLDFKTSRWRKVPSVTNKTIKALDIGGYFLRKLLHYFPEWL